ncbi:LLM class flavin-dependent oxidoreductase [Amycolatopsis sp. NPDC059657]|uniref:LLM class flavin-dependent oxidoreductase n=1 Tax=Amycolatopsis sp. NPDC059657 TaxID=3346899 RepID=UPI003672FF10
MKPFRFGIVAGMARDLPTWTGLAKQAEDLGFDTFLATDPVVDADPLTLLSAAAAVTSTLKLGTFVLADPYRDRRQLAWQVKSLHDITAGRFELGLGVGHPGAGERSVALGGEFPSPAKRLARLSETIDYLREHAPGPRLLLAGSRPKMLALAAREADTLSFAWRPQTTEADAKSIVDSFESDRDVELAMNLTAVAGKPAPWLKQYGIDVQELAGSGAVSVLPEDPDHAADTLRRWRAQWGISYITVNSGYLEQFAPIVERLVGN